MSEIKPGLLLNWWAMLAYLENISEQRFIVLILSPRKMPSSRCLNRIIHLFGVDIEFCEIKLKYWMHLL